MEQQQTDGKYLTAVELQTALCGEQTEQTAFIKASQLKICVEMNPSLIWTHFILFSSWKDKAQ